MDEQKPMTPEDAALLAERFEQPAPLKKKDVKKALTWRRPPNMKFDITASDRVDEQTWAVLDSLCPNKRVLLQYSTGKDSIAAWFELKERGYTVIPYFREVVPHMSFFDGPIKAHEEFFGTEVQIVPNKVALFSLLRFFNDTNDLARFGVDLKDEIVYQAESKSALKRYRRMMVDTLMQEHQCDVCIIGTKASDSLHRRTHFKVDGPYLPSERLFSLVWRLKKSAPFQIAIDNKIPLPRYYLWLGRSPDFMLEHEFYFIKKYYPTDYAKMQEMFRNLDVYVTKYEHMKALSHAVKPSRLVIEAQDAGHPFA